MAVSKKEASKAVASAKKSRDNLSAREKDERRLGTGKLTETQKRNASDAVREASKKGNYAPYPAGSRLAASATQPRLGDSKMTAKQMADDIFNTSSGSARARAHVSDSKKREKELEELKKAKQRALDAKSGKRFDYKK